MREPAGDRLKDDASCRAAWLEEAGPWELFCKPEIASAAKASSRLDDIAEAVASGGAPATLALWRSQRALIVARSDQRLLGFARATEQLASKGWPVRVRASGGGAFPVTPGIAQIAMIAPHPVRGVPFEAVYGALAKLLRRTFATYGLDAGTQRVPGAFCSGLYDITLAGRKVAGTAQLWRRGNGNRGYVMATAAVLIDEDPTLLTDVVNQFYRLAGSRIRCDASAVTALRAHLRSVDATGDLVAAFTERLQQTFKKNAEFGV